MSTDADIEIWANRAAMALAQPPLLSVAVPFHAYDVRPLAQELAAQAQRLSTRCELVFADDGSPAADVADGLRQRWADDPTPFRLLSSRRNLGRSAIRNRLATAARATWVLYLDSDMLPDDVDFLGRYRALCDDPGSDAICGGRSYRRVPEIDRQYALYHQHSLRTECLPAAVRQQQPQRYILTNNLMVRRELLLRQPFVEAYRGWGFEDIDWALGLNPERVRHIDNSASHLGLIDDAQLFAKIQESRPNFCLIAQRAPGFRTFPIYRLASRLSRQPLPLALLASISQWLARAQRLPLRLRQLALQAFRSFSYAEALRADASHQ